MYINDIVSGVNAKLAGEQLTFEEMVLFLDETIDDINRELNACYPAFSEVDRSLDYNYFPNKYIRSVVITGAAYKFYVTDEEGIITATQYQYDYLNNLFAMKRDYSASVPEEYLADEKGYLTGPSLLNADNIIQIGWDGGW